MVRPLAGRNRRCTALSSSQVRLFDASEVVADVPASFLESVGEGPVADQALEGSSVVEARVLEGDGEEDRREGACRLCVERDLCLTVLLHLLKDVQIGRAHV